MEEEDVLVHVREDMKGVLFLCCGPSGVGKTSLGRALRAQCPELVLSVSYTTRAARVGERDGEDYHFVDEATFLAMRDAERFAEWACVHGNYYATPRAAIEQAWRGGEDVFFDIDYQGAVQLQRAYPRECASVLIIPPSMEVLEHRLRDRSTDSEEVIARRLDAAHHELLQYRVFDFLICNDTFEHALEQLVQVYRASRLRTYMWEEGLGEMLERGAFVSTE